MKIMLYLEIIDLIENKTKLTAIYTDENRIGDHICYYSNLSKIKSHFPKWKITIPLDEIINQIIFSWNKK